MGRHAFFRSLFMLQMFQQSGYKINEFRKWLLKNWSAHGVTVAHAAFNLLLLILLLYLDPVLTSTTTVIILTVFAVFWFGSIKPYVQNEVKKPLVFTPRMKRLAILLAAVSLPLPLYGMFWAFTAGIRFPDIYILGFTWIIADLLIPLFLMISATLIAPLERYFQNGFIKQARAKLDSMPGLKVIAITGSYGKTSTKFILKTILQERFNVCATPGSYNTPMGICKVINNDLEASHQILILEMGARYEGNIDELCEIAPPDIAVITNIGVAHLETFGSVEAIARTKGSLLQHLRKNGWAVLNAEDEQVMKLKPPPGIRTITAGLQYGEVRAENIQYDSNGGSFQVKDHQAGEEETVKTRLLGAHNVQNIVLGIAVGKVLGLRMKTMAMALAKMEPVEHRMELKSQNGMVVIDDAFNSNPVGARNAIDTLSRFEGGRKFLITPGMIELGDREDSENRELGRFIGQKQIDKVFLVGENQTKSLREGLVDSGYDQQNIEVVSSLYEANRRLESIYQSGDIVLYENDLPDAYNEPQVSP